MNLDLMKGAAKSITMWAGGVLLALGQIAPFINEQTMVSLGLQGRSVQFALTAAAIVMWACRTITSKSLTEKGGGEAVPPPAVIPSGSTITGDKITVVPPGDKG